MLLGCCLPLRWVFISTGDECNLKAGVDVGKLKAGLVAGWRFGFSSLRGSSVLLGFLPLLSFGLDRFELEGGRSRV